MDDTEKDALRAENMDLRAKLDAIEQAEGLPDLLAKYTQACVRNDALTAERDAARGALKVFISHEVGYMDRNNLGDPEKQHRVIQGRDAILALRTPDATPTTTTATAKEIE